MPVSWVHDSPYCIRGDQSITMDIATRNDLTKLRDMLTHRLGELRADLQAADLAIAESRASAPGFEEVSDTKDAATQASSVEVLGAQRLRDADELALVEAALQRLDGGHYGDCSDCGEPIALARLRVQPAAMRCARCQAAAEQR
jgi:DnaK suppressor protein